MSPRLTTWHEVQVDMYVRDRQEKVWYVEAERDGKILLRDAHEDRKVIERPDGAIGVTVLEPTDVEALALVASALGGEVVAKHEEGKPSTCPPLRRRVQEVHMHMFMMHGIWTQSGPGSKSIEKLLEIHREDHETHPHASHAWVEHIHKEIY